MTIVRTPGSSERGQMRMIELPKVLGKVSLHTQKKDQPPEAELSSLPGKGPVLFGSEYITPLTKSQQFSIL